MNQQVWHCFRSKQFQVVDDSPDSQVLDRQFWVSHINLVAPSFPSSFQAVLRILAMSLAVYQVGG